MPSKKTRTPLRGNALQILRGGKAVPKDLVRQCITDIQQTRKTQLDQRIATERQMAKYLGQVQGVVKPDGRDAHVARSLDGLLSVHEKLAKQKLLAPKVPGALGGILPGRITVNVAPPFDYDVIIPTVLAGNEPTLQGSADRNTGKINVSAITATQPGFNGGSMCATVGVYFHPFGPGTLTLHAASTYSFQWWTNSLGANNLLRSFGSGGLTIYGVDVAGQTTGATGTIVTVASKRFQLWDENQTAQVRFDFGFDVQTPTSVQVEVNHNLVYLLFVEADVHVEGVGWPGSLAGAKMSVTVPSLTYDFQVQQVFQA